MRKQPPELGLLRKVRAIPEVRLMIKHLRKIIPPHRDIGPSLRSSRFRFITRNHLVCLRRDYHLVHIKNWPRWCKTCFYNLGYERPSIYPTYIQVPYSKQLGLDPDTQPNKDTEPWPDGFH